jgi:hypothetical protein
VTAFKGRLHKARASFSQAKARVLAGLRVPGSRKVNARVKRPLDATYGGFPGAVCLVAAWAGPSAVHCFQISSDQESWAPCPEAVKRKTLVTGLTVGSTYYFRVQTQTPSGLSAWSAAVSFVVR